MIATVVLAAGGGSRFGALKQFALLHGIPLVAHAVATATDISEVVVVVLPEGQDWGTGDRCVTVRGGATRAASVRCGVAAVPLGCDVIAVHDAAHPLASRALFESAIGQVREGAAAAIPVVPVTETLGFLDRDRLVGTIPREGTIVAVQSPQVFRADLLRRVLSEGVETRDEISLMLSQGYPVAIVAGDPGNIHVTTPQELEVAARLRQRR